MNNKDYEELKKDFEELRNVNIELMCKLSSQNGKLYNLYNSLKQSNEKLKVGDEVEFTGTLEKAIIIFIDEHNKYYAIVYDDDNNPTRITNFNSDSLYDYVEKTGKHFDEISFKR